MKTFLDQQFLLETPTARQLYHDYAQDLPICDYHCHIDAAVLAANRPFNNLSEVWLGGDHYKWRAMRIFGIPEREITGAATPKEKFDAFARTMPYLIGNPLYHWTHLELQRYFDLDVPLGPDTADMIWETANQKLQQPDFYPMALATRAKVRIICTTDDPVDSLQAHATLAAAKAAGRNPEQPDIFPAFRPDKALRMAAADFTEYVARLGQASGVAITSFGRMVEALAKRARFFHEHGCRLSDHALDRAGYCEATPAELDSILTRRLQGSLPATAELIQYQTGLLCALAGIYRELGWTMQLHIGALRNTNSPAFSRLGADTGYDAIQDLPAADSISQLLNRMVSQPGGLPRTMLFSLNDKDNYTLAALTSTFQKDGQANWVGLGPAWWFHDQRDGMVKHLKNLCNVGVLAGFAGMTTDSRSLLSYTRHEYFRRILCNQLAEWVENGEYPNDQATLKDLIERVGWLNARSLFS